MKVSTIVLAVLAVYAVYGLAFKNGTQTQTLNAIPAGGLVTVWTHGANTIVVN